MDCAFLGFTSQVGDFYGELVFPVQGNAFREFCIDQQSDFAHQDSGGAAVGFACDVGHIHTDFVGVERIIALVFQVGLGDEIDVEIALIVAGRLAMGYFLGFSHGLPPPPAPPGEGGLAHHMVFYACPADAIASVGFHMTVHAYILPDFELFGRLVQGDFEGGALVFFYRKIMVSYVFWFQFNLKTKIPC